MQTRTDRKLTRTERRAVAAFFAATGRAVLAQAEQLLTRRGYPCDPAVAQLDAILSAVRDGGRLLSA